MSAPEKEYPEWVLRLREMDAALVDATLHARGYSDAEIRDFIVTGRLRDA